MKLKDIRGSYATKSTSASTVSRQASFAGIALIWVFKTQHGSTLVLPNDLLLPTFFLTLSLAFDLLQYVISSAIWGIFNRIKEIEHGPNYEGDIGVSKYLNWPAIFFFWGKLLFVLIGYYYIFNYVLTTIKFAT